MALPINAHIMNSYHDASSKDAQPLLLLLSGGFSSLGLGRQLASHGGGLELLLRLLLVLSKHHLHGVLGLDAVHLHKVPALRDVVEVSGPVLGGLEGLVLLVHEDDVFPLGEEVSRLVPQVRYRRHEVLEGRVVGVVHEEGVHSHGEKSALNKMSAQTPHTITSNKNHVHCSARTMVIKVCSSLLCQNQCVHVPSGAIMPG